MASNQKVEPFGEREGGTATGGDSLLILIPWNMCLSFE